MDSRREAGGCAGRRAGRSTRLSNATLALPKPLLAIDETHAFLDVLVDEIARHDFEDIVLHDSMAALLEMRRRVHSFYEAAFADVEDIVIASPPSDRFEPVAWFSCALMPADRRAAAMAACHSANIDLRPFFNSLSAMPAFHRYAQVVPQQCQPRRQQHRSADIGKGDAGACPRDRRHYRRQPVAGRIRWH